MQAKARRRGPRGAGTAPIPGPISRPISGVAAAAVLLVISLVMLGRHAPLLDVLKFTGFVVAGVGLPGLVLWRLIGAYRRNLVEDCAAAFAIGTSVQLVVYLASASVGLQRWSWAWAPVVLLIGVLDRDVRERVWRRVEAPLAPVTAWLLAGACAVVLFAVLRTGPDRYAPPYTNPDASYADMAFHQALAASARTDVPIVPLWVAGEPMKYHVFFHQVTAAMSWATGIDLADLVYGLAWLPLMLASCALVFVLTQRFLVRPGREPHPAAGWAGPLAVLVAGVGGALQPLPDDALGAVSMATAAYLSPSQNLGVMLGLLLAVVCIDLLRDQPPRTRWILAALLALVASGSKATVLPLIICGFGLVFLVRLIAGRPGRIAFLGGVVMVLVFVGSVIAIFGGESSGLQIDPGAVFVQLPPYADLRDGTGVDRAAQLLSAAATLTAWGLAVVGVLFLRRFWRDPGTVFLAGASIGAFIATVLTTQPGISQMYFYRTAVPFLVVLSCLGLAHLVDRLSDRRAPVLVAGASVLGVIACLLAREAAAGHTGVKVPFLWTLGALLAVALVVAVSWRSGRRGGTVLTAFLAAAVAACMVGATALPLAGLVSDQANLLIYGRPGRYGPTTAQADAARWLKDNTNRGDLVATNAHCIVRRGTVCDSRHFWIAALSERQVLVEGWAYTNRANRIGAASGINPSVLPFWDERLLAANDAAFTAPSAPVIDRLRRYGVRWLYADRRAGEISPNLARYVRLRHSTPDAAIYEIS